MFAHFSRSIRLADVDDALQIESQLHASHYEDAEHTSKLSRNAKVSWLHQSHPEHQSDCRSPIRKNGRALQEEAIVCRFGVLHKLKAECSRRNDIPFLPTGVLNFGLGAGDLQLGVDLASPSITHPSGVSKAKAIPGSCR